MELSPTFCLKISAISLFLVFFSCNQRADFYKKELTTIEAKLAATHVMNGSHRYYQGSVPEQILLDKALELDPENADAWRERGIAYLKRGFAAEYFPYYKKAVEVDPLAWQGWRGYIYLYFYRDYERALADFNATDILTPDVVDYPQSTSVDFMRAICYLKLEENDKAIAYLDQHIEEELSTVELKYVDTKSFLFRGIAFHRNGQYEKAINNYKRALEHASENSDLWYWLAKTNVAAGDFTAARAAIEKADSQFKKGYFNKRNYVAEFFQIYQPDIDELKAQIDFSENAYN